jgi:hypothetical protein
MQNCHRCPETSQADNRYRLAQANFSGKADVDGTDRVRVRTSTLIAALLIAAPALACTNARESHGAASQATPTPTAGLPPTTARPSCQTALPASWQQAIETSGVSAGGVSTVPLAVGRAGEVAAVRDNVDTRDLLLIGTDRSVTKTYSVPDPNRNNVGLVAMDDRWTVVGVDRIPRGSNGVLPGLIRIDVIDRQGGGVRTVAQQSEADYGTGRNVLDSVALLGGKVYWITRETYAGNTGTVSSYDLGSGAVADVASGAVRDVRATAGGVTWVGDSRQAEVKVPAALPPPVADALGTARDRVTVATDGTAYAWVTGLDQGGTGVGWWSPGSGPVRITGEAMRPRTGPASVSDWVPRVYVVGPYVVIDTGRPSDTSGQTNATVVDARAGAVTYLREAVAGADGGTIAAHLAAGAGKTTAGVIRSGALPPLSC